MKSVISLILKILGVILVIPASLALILGLWMLITGQDGFTDAAPWWLFLLMIACALGLPGLILLFLARFISKGSTPENEVMIK
jgi:hypothetical protein